MVHIGTVKNEYQGETKMLNRIRIGWELPTETRVFNPEKGEQPMMIENTYTLSMHEKATLRAVLQSWRGKPFTEDEARAFDVTKLLGVPCMINVIHKPSKDGTRLYSNIAGVTPMPKGVACPPQVNPTFELNYDEFDQAKFESLPEFIRNEMKGSVEYLAKQGNTFITKADLDAEKMKASQGAEIGPDDLPF